MTKRLEIRPSNLSRVSACPASPALSASMSQDGATEYANEGTAAHQLAENCLVLNDDPDNYIGETMAGVEVTEEMADAVRVFWDFVSDLVYSERQPEVTEDEAVEAFFTERRYNVDSLGANFDGGTVDALVIRNENGRRVLHLVDYKHGVGVSVPVFENKQLLAYAVCVCERLGYEFDEVVLTVIQPRAVQSCDGSWAIPIQRVKDFREELVQIIADANAAAERIENQAAGKMPILTAGDHCQFCPARSICPIHISTFKRFVEMADKKPEALNPDELAFALDNADTVSRYIKAVKEYVLGEFNEGRRAATGYKLIAKRGQRRWKLDETEIIFALEGVLDRDEIYTTKLKTPAQIEKLIPKTVSIDGLIERPDVGVKVVKETTPGEDLLRPTAEEDFSLAT